MMWLYKLETMGQRQCLEGDNKCTEYINCDENFCFKGSVRFSEGTEWDLFRMYSEIFDYM